MDKVKKERKFNHINYALVEGTRPAIYTAMKYWGKKPHNIWREYIETYTDTDGLYLDPFAGSAISVFEAVKTNRKAIGFDLNPITAFLIEALSSEFDKEAFEKKYTEIYEAVYQDEKYKKFFTSNCPNCKKSADLQHAKWEGRKIYEVGIHCDEFKGSRNKDGKKIKIPDENDKQIADSSNEIEIETWYPSKKFPESPSFNDSFKKCIGGDDFKNLWTRRNLYVLSLIFSLILDVKETNVRLQLLFGFIQTLHLCTKMSPPRRDAANRPFSTSWGRSAYLCPDRKMEMNPLFVFKSSCFGKQSVESSLSAAKEYLGKQPKLLYVNKGNKSNRSKNFDIKYGIVDINTIRDYIDDKSISFIMTDPPYGDLVQYLDLSSLWLVWLEKTDERYKPNYDAEIIIKKGVFDTNAYKIKFLNGIKNLRHVLEDDGRIVFTFHNKKIEIWNAFLQSLSLAGFKIEKVIHQQNRRSGESNVAMPYGTSATDFYIRCKKASNVSLKTDFDEYQHFVITKAIEIIGARNEPTPYQFLFNGLLTEISKAGFNLENFDANIEKILSKNVDKIFKLTKNNDNKAGVYWWFVNPEKHIKYPDKKLSERVEESIVALLRRKVAVNFDEVLAEIFVKYPNGLTPDIRSIDSILKKYAIKSGGKWKYNSEKVEKDFTKHTEILLLLNNIGKKLGYQTYIGKREQPEEINGKKLSDYVTFKNVDSLNQYDRDQRARIGMIDMLWIKDNKIKCAIEVENSTKFTSGIQRGSNIEDSIPKLMVMPDARKKEFLNITDPLFTENFQARGWSYIFYSDLEKLEKKGKINHADIESQLKKI